MSNYYVYENVKVMIAHKLMSMEGWKVYGYKSDESDSMTDYYSPANWNGIAEKNGYVLCIDVCGASEPIEIRKYNYSGFTYDKKIMEKIEKLQQMTVERGASKQEEESAKISMKRLQEKAETSEENKTKYVVIGTIPRHMENPKGYNWHIEKDGIIIERGRGILKYAEVYDYYNYESYIKQLQEFNENQKKFEENYIEKLMQENYYNTEEEVKKATEKHFKKMQEITKICKNFEEFINKIDMICGSLIGKDDSSINVMYEKIKVIQHKIELKAVETKTGDIKEGQLFILKSNFNYGYIKGFVYRIHERESDNNNKKSYYAYKLNSTLTKECTGNATKSNCWLCFNEKFLKWIENGCIMWCELHKVKTPHEIEKVIKKTIPSHKKEQDRTTEIKFEADISNLKFQVLEDTDTRTDEKIYLVKVTDKLDREAYKKVKEYLYSLGGYYSKFEHAFLFKENPVNLFNINSN